jgi:hypothetical protein
MAVLVIPEMEGIYEKWEKRDGVAVPLLGRLIVVCLGEGVG